MGVLSDVSLGASIGFVVVDQDPRTVAIDCFQGSLIVWIDESIPFFNPQYFYKKTSGSNLDHVMVIMRNHYTAIVNPAATDNDVQGFSEGSEWYNTATGKLWKCVASNGTATWIQLN